MMFDPAQYRQRTFALVGPSVSRLLDDCDPSSLFLNSWLKYPCGYDRSWWSTRPHVRTWLFFAVIAAASAWLLERPSPRCRHGRPRRRRLPRARHRL
jgi:hypothetical protein